MPSRGWIALAVDGLAACAQIVGADFDPKRVAATTSGGGAGGTSGEGGNFYTLTSDAAGSTVFANLHYGSTYDVAGARLPDVGEGHTFVKLAPDHRTYLWVQAFGVTGPADPQDNVTELYPWDLATAPDGRIAVCGHLANEVDYGGDTLSAVDGRDAFIAVFSP